MAWSVKLRKLSECIVRPVCRVRWFFFAVMVLCCLPCMAFSVVEGVRIFHFLAFSVAEGVAVAYLLAWGAVAIGRRTWRRVYMIVCAVLLGGWTLMEIGCLAATHTLISDDTIALMAETDTAEAAGFFTQYFGLRAVGVLMAVVAAGVALAAALWWVAGLMLLRRLGVVVMAVSLMALVPAGTVCLLRLLPGAFISDLQRYMVWAGEGGDNPELIRANEVRYAAPVVKAPCVINGYRLVNGSFDRWLRVQEEAMRAKVCGSDSAQFNVVVVVGESFIRSHSQLYGYYLPTNPRLSAECDSGRLIVYDDVVTTANFTTPALRNMLNLNNLSAGEEWYDGVYFPLLMRRAGYCVYH
ncbi:MAG: sulfatase-like hydrolase/transferase, partial [Paramuribaculum sp.]|nr:sulfatase-like hydrolase/transferase [Paramuribaculum sp.]